MSDCSISPDVGAVRAVLTSVDCHTHDIAQRGYLALTGAGSPFQAALTILLTLYVAVAGYRLVFAPDGARLSDAPRMALKIGAILALVTSWSVFQTLVFDVAAGAPLEISRMISAPGQAGFALNADPISRLQTAYDQLSTEAERYSKAAGPATAVNVGAMPGAARALSAAGGTLLMANAGLIAVADIAVGVMCAVGPVFIALFLFVQTRGLFVGWLRALLAAAMSSLTAWALAVLMLNALDPWLQTLARQRGQNVVDPNTAMTAAFIVFVFAAGQVALVIAGSVVALGLRFPGDRQVAAASVSGAAGASEAANMSSAPLSRPAQLADRLQWSDQREVRAVLASAPVAPRTSMTARRRSPEGLAEPQRIGELYRRPRAGA